jgi:hypothetical protein
MTEYFEKLGCWVCSSHFINTRMTQPTEGKVLHITKRKRETYIQHYCKSDDVRTDFKVKNEKVWSSNDASKPPCPL